ncbi:MAG: hypothetical protein JXR77_15645 [Lentisphaeria bacterium]|nr:hypothetical protein [Lentisphaeria bacterium]
MGLVLAGAASAADYVWIEAEKPTSSTVTFESSGWGNKEFLSEEAWLGLKLDAAQQAQAPRGMVLDYEFSAPSGGRYQVWNRVGFEFIRSPFEWRIDEGEWDRVEPTDLTTDLMEIATWNEVAWIQMGETDLDPGRHTLQIRALTRMAKEQGKDVNKGVMYYSDVLCLTKGAFRPNGAFQPDTAWQVEEDLQAAAQVFRFPAGEHLAPGERSELPLAGLWQVARYDENDVQDRAGPTPELPDPDTLFWKGISVPGNKFRRRDLVFAHRLIYRTRIEVPAERNGHSFVLSLPSQSLIATVLVNGRMVGWSKAPFAPFACDLTPAIRPGSINEICVVIKDSYYAISETKSGQSCRMRFNIPLDRIHENYVGQFFDFPIASVHYAPRSGILLAPSLVVTGGPVYTTDVFAKPYVTRKMLALEVSLRNPTGADQTVQVHTEILPFEGGAAERTLESGDHVVPAGKEITIETSKPWPDPTLWWPDSPARYVAVTRVTSGGKVVDVVRTAFGFREWSWDGAGPFRLNGVPWQFWADCTSFRSAEDQLTYCRRSGQNMVRFWSDSLWGLDAPEVLDRMDAAGIAVRRSGIFDGQGANYLHKLAEGTELFDNWLLQLQAQVRAERNHPSILIWSIENEITFINSRNLGLKDRVEPQVSRVGNAILAYDPTRPVMVDGGNCLQDNSLPVNGVHYIETDWRYYPDEAYTLERAYRSHSEPTLGHWGKAPWQLVPDRPIFMGEAYYIAGNQPSAYAQFGGEGAFVGWGPDACRGAGLLARMLYEGYRWHGVAATQVWGPTSQMADLQQDAYKAVCILCREWNWTFGGPAGVARTLKVFNNTRFGSPITAAWQLELEGRTVASGRRVCALAPGGNEQFDVTLDIPAVAGRAEGRFVLTCSRDGNEVFRAVKPVAVIDPEAGTRCDLPRDRLIVLDPFGSVKRRLAARGTAFTEVASSAAIPDGAKVIVLGRDALDSRESTDPRWLARAGAGATVLALEQAHPLRFQALPADVTATDFSGRVGFMEDPDHPVFAGLGQQDFFTWSGDHIVYRNVYTKPTRGAVSLAHCDHSLGCSAILSAPVNEGLILACQMVVAGKLDSDPVARRLFDNLLAYAATYRPVRRTTAAVIDPESPEGRLLSASGLKFDFAGDLESTIREKRHDIVVFAATPANLASLAAAPREVRDFTGRGGWLMAWGLTPEGLADFNRIVGVEHLIRPFELERVTMAPVRDPVIAGVTVRDVAMETGEKIFGWQGTRYMVDDEFRYVVDTDEIGPFCLTPGAAPGDTAAAKKAAAGWSRNLFNGFTSDDAWKLIYYMSVASPRIDLTFPRAETITDLGIGLNAHYAIAAQVNLYADGAAQPVSIDLEPRSGRQQVHLETPLRVGKTLTVELARFDKEGKTTGIDNLWITVARSDTWRASVKPLLNVGGLVKYPMGKGGLVLNQLNIQANEALPVNAQKKSAIAAALLRNLHAQFSGGQILTTGDLTFQPLDIHDRYNQYLTRDKGWFRGNRDIAHVPTGKTQLAGVTYQVADFRTSPVPSCVMLAGPGVNGTMPAEVKGLPVARTAAVLFFLHTFGVTRPWTASRNSPTPPVLFHYRIHYADGESVDVPVLYDRGVGHWVSPSPSGLPEAALAWAGKLPDSDKEYAVLYQLQWNNPRPNVEIQSIDMVRDTEAHGAPALLAVTAASKAE